MSRLTFFCRDYWHETVNWFTLGTYFVYLEVNMTSPTERDSAMSASIIPFRKLNIDELLENESPRNIQLALRDHKIWALVMEKMLKEEDIDREILEKIIDENNA